MAFFYCSLFSPHNLALTCIPTIHLEQKVTKHITISLPLKASVLITAARPRLKEEIQSKDRDIFQYTVQIPQKRRSVVTKKLPENVKYW